VSDSTKNRPPPDDRGQSQTQFHADQSGLETGRKIPTLLVIRGKNLGEEFVLNHPSMTIGRTLENDIFLNDPRISRHHARAIVEQTEEDRPPKVVLLDMDSTNGLRVNDERTREAVLKEGDKVAMGDTLLRFNYQDMVDLRYQSQIKNLINVDHLTRLLTKRAFDIQFEQALVRAGSEGERVSVLMMDIDHFKEVNDQHDHLFGSFVLHHVGKIIKRVLDAHGVSGRYGGEEFNSFLPNIDKRKAKLLAEKLRIAIADHDFVKDGVKLNITISIGVSTYPEDGEQPEILVQRADHALYRAKNSGRNRVCLFDSATDE